jgi:protein-S-isoprenylcysteine O-methyltransferase Ste14
MNDNHGTRDGPSRLLRVSAAALVTAQFVLLALLAAYPRAATSSEPTIAVGGLLVACGVLLALAAAPSLGRALTVSPIPAHGGSLRTNGLYKYVRHPMYAGVTLAGVGLALVGQTWVHVLAVLAIGLVLTLKMRIEEERLRALHPDYNDYARSTGALVPRLRHRPTRK